MSAAQAVAILGIGNILCGDDGFGPRLLKLLGEKYDFPANVELMDGGTQGQALYCHVERADFLLLLDAVDFGDTPGTLVVKSGEEIPHWLGARKMSAHQASFQETLALASLKGVAPRQITLAGMQPQNVEFGARPSASLLEALEPAAKICLDILAAWSVFPTVAARPKNSENPWLVQSPFALPD